MRRPAERRGEIGLHLLPETAQALLNQLNAPPRLVAHLLLVHDAAFRLVTLIQAKWRDIPLDFDAILFGAAIHDIGKIQYPEELSFTGDEHERAGERMLIDAGFGARVARFARTHGSWPKETSIELEDLIVALADTCWKGKRDDELEGTIVEKLSAVVTDERWSIFLALDDMIETVANDASRRVTWQASFNVESNEAP